MGERRKAETATETTKPTTAAYKTLRHEIMFSALASANYHSMRENFFVRAYRVATAVQALAATAAFAAIAKTFPESWAAWLSLFVMVAAIFTLVWDPAGSARRHQGLRRRFYDIYARAEAATSDKELRTIRRDMRIIYADEPPGFAIAKAIAYNAAATATYPREEAKEHKIKITRPQRWLANIWPFRGWAPKGA